ncbi:MAG: recombination-associated protein RdgC [Deltaproteobacteria bacterium]|nr:recombination-associated protein RdgC [Deltaproteobacteria bacterium]
MGALKGTASYMRVTIQGDAPDSMDDVEQAIEIRRFVPLTAESEELESSGWVPFEEPYDDVNPIMRDRFHFGDLICLAYREDKVVLPTALFRHEVELRIEKVEEETGEKVDKQMKHTIELAIQAELRQKVLPRSKIIEMVWSQSTREMRVFARGKIVTERICDLFERTFELPFEVNDYARQAFELDLSDGSRSILEGLCAENVFEPVVREIVEDERFAR